MTLISTHAAPDLLLFDKTEDQADIVRVSTAHAPVRKVGRRETDGLSEIILSTDDLRKLLKAAFRVGWSHHIMHVEQLSNDMKKEIGG